MHAPTALPTHHSTTLAHPQSERPVLDLQRLETIALWLEAGAPEHGPVKRFDMAAGITAPSTSARATCNTACCIAGAAVQFFEARWAARQPLEAGIMDWRALAARARMALGLSEAQASVLFEPDFAHGGRMDRYSDPAWAARTVRHLMATGVADWEAAAEART